MEEALVSILIPVYNRAHLVGETIESAVNQTYKRIEIIIVDNCSTDNTWSVLQNYQAKDNRIRIFKNAENVGPVLNWKRCIDEAKGEYAKILFSDDLISANFIEGTIKFFDCNTAFVLSKIKVFNDIINESKNGLYVTREKFSVKEYFTNILLKNTEGFPVSPGCALFRTSDLIESLEVDIQNTLNLNFRKYGAGNDLLLYLNTARKYSEIKISNSTCSYFRAHADSFTISNNLSIYYYYSILYFTKVYFPEILPKLKSISWIRMKKDKKNKIYFMIEGKSDWFFLVKASLKNAIRNF